MHSRIFNLVEIDEECKKVSVEEVVEECGVTDDYIYDKLESNLTPVGYVSDTEDFDGDADWLKSSIDGYATIEKVENVYKVTFNRKNVEKYLKDAFSNFQAVLKAPRINSFDSFCREYDTDRYTLKQALWGSNFEFFFNIQSYESHGETINNYLEMFRALHDIFDKEPETDEISFYLIQSFDYHC